MKTTGATRFFRILLPTVLIVVWVAAALYSGPYLSKISGLTSTDLNTFLPKNAESYVASQEFDKFNDTKTPSSIPVVIVYNNSGRTLRASDMSKLGDVNARLAKVSGVVETIAAPLKSDDGKAALTLVPLKSDGDFRTIFANLKHELASAKLPLTYTFTGPASFAYDLQNSFTGIDSTLLIVAVSVVFLILLAVYRSPILPLLVLGSAVAALTPAVLVVYNLAKDGTVLLNEEVQGILFILVIGAATDYSLLYIARFREELTNHPTAWKATWAALKSSYAAIIAAGGTVAVGLLCLLLSDLGSNRALGPVGGIGIGFAVLAALTLLPSLLLLFGRSVFWPRKPRHIKEKASTHFLHNHPVWAHIGELVSRHPRRVWAASLLLLLVGSLGVLQLNANGIPESDLVIGKSEARDGQAIMDAHFPPGLSSPMVVLASVGKEYDVVKALDADKGVASVAISVTGVGDKSSMPVGESGAKMISQILSAVRTQRDQQVATIKATIEKQMAGLPKASIDTTVAKATAKIPTIDELEAQANPFTGAKVKIADGKVMLLATLNDPADSMTARDTVARLRTATKKFDDGAMISGSTAAQLDTSLASARDLRIVFPLILLSVTIILMLLLRAFVAPLVLLLSTILSFGATMGIAAFVFNHIWHFAGVDPMVIIIGLVFLVALGIDYNIFLMTRVREETIKSGVRKGTIKGLVVTGGVITSAGIVLASTFAALGVIPMLYLAEIAFIVTFGVLLDTIIVRSLLVPALTLEIGRIMWWPSRLFRKKK